MRTKLLACLFALPVLSISDSSQASVDIAPPAPPAASPAFAPPAPPASPAPPLPAMAPTPPMPPVPAVPVIALATPPQVAAIHHPSRPHVRAFRVSMGRVRLGVQISSMTPELRKFFGAPEDAGLLVQQVQKDSMAQAAKVAVGDVIVKVDGDPIEGVGDVYQALADNKSGELVEVVVIRNKKSVTLKTKLPEKRQVSGDLDDWRRHLPEGFDFKLPPEVEQLLSQKDSQQLQKQLETLNEQLQQLQERLERIESGKGKAKSKNKTRGKAKAKSKVKTKSKK